MDSKKRRSALRKSIARDMDNMKTQIKRRISFSGKNSVRVFHGEEEPKSWNNSYEISDHLNVNETASNLGASSMNKYPRSSLKKKGNKENIVQPATIQQELQMEISHHQNVPISNNLSILSANTDLINVSYQNQNSKIHPIEYSVDITLNDEEIQYQVKQNNAAEETNNLYSFSLEDDEKEAISAMSSERTVDFMRELRGDTSNMRENVSIFNEYMDQDQYLDFTCTKGKHLKEPITIYMNDSLSISSNEQVSASNRKADNKRKTIQQATEMHLSPITAKQYDKENINPALTRSANETQNDCCEMEINDEILSQPQINSVNVEKESLAFLEKVNCFSFLHDSDDNMQIENSLHSSNIEPNMKSRSTINFNEIIEMSPKETLSKNKINSRPTINFNQPIEISPKGKYEIAQINQPIKKMRPRQTNNFNKTIELSPKNENAKTEYNFASTDKSRQTINFNKSIEVDSAPAAKCSQHGAIPKVKGRPTINFNQPIETSLLEVKSNLSRQTINLNEDICETPVKLIQEPVSVNSLNVPGSTNKHSQQAKLVVRKICALHVNKPKNPINLDEQRMLRYKKKQEQNMPTPNVIETKNQLNTDKSLNFSLNNAKNMSLLSESSSPLIPSEFKAFNLKQLNDEIEHGKINVFANIPKTPNTDRKVRNAASNFHSKYVPISQPSTEQRRTLVFEDVDIAISSDDTTNKDPKFVNSNNYFDFNNTQDVIAVQDRKNAKCRYSQADDLLLDNTSFLTRAKLSDETVSRNSSKREITQLNDIMGLFDESLRDAASKLDLGLQSSSVKSKKLCNDTLSSMFQNAKPVFTQTITNIKECNNFMDAYDIMDVSSDVRSCKYKEHGQNVDINILHQGQTLHLCDNIESCDNTNNHNNIINNDQQVMHDSHSNGNKQERICTNKKMENDYNYVQDIEKQQQVSIEKSTRQAILFKNENKEQDTIKQQRPSTHTLYLSEAVDQDLNYENKGVLDKCPRQTMYLNNNIDESIDTDVIKENSIKTNIVYGNNCTYNLTNCHDDIDDKEIGINVEKDVIYSRRRQTLYLNEDIANDKVSDETNHQGQDSVNVQDIQELSEKSKNPRRHTTYFDNDSIIDDNLVIVNVPENFEILENPQSFMYHQENNLDGTIKTQSLAKASIQVEKTTETDSHMLNLNPMRKTLYFHSEIPIENGKYFNNENLLEKASSHLVKIVEEENAKPGFCNSNSKRKTLCFNNEISFKAKSIQIDKNFEAVNPDAFICHSKPRRKTLHFNDDACELDETKAQAVDHQLCKKVSQSRKSIHISQDMDVTLNEVEVKSDSSSLNNDQLLDPTIDAINCNKADKKVSQSRKSIHISQDMDVTLNEVEVKSDSSSLNNDQLLDPTIDTINCNKADDKADKKVSQLRKSIHISQDMDVTLNEVEEKSDSSSLNNDQLLDPTIDAINCNKADVNIDIRPSRKSIYTAKCMDLELNGYEPESNETVNKSQVCTILRNVENSKMDLSLDVPQPTQSASEEEDEEEKKVASLSQNNHPNEEKRKTLYFDGNNDMSLDQSFTPAEMFQLNETAEPLNAAKMALVRNISLNSLTNKSKITNKQENSAMTPDNNPNNRIFYITPRLSLLEFKAAEKKAKEEYLSPFRNEVANKRLPANLTPVLSIPKKRQTLLFDDCLMDESDTSSTIVGPNEQSNNMEESMRQEAFDLCNHAISNNVMNISGIVSNESVLQTPSKQRKSRIPIPISSGIKSNISFTLLETSRENHQDADTEQTDGDNLAESIQFMRRATTFTQRRDTTIRGTDFDVEILPGGKPSIFEGNPITISDVTVFFEAQRNSNNLVLQTENSLALEQINTSGINAIEHSNKSMENRYLNLTLEDIEKTRLSLVRISYEDHEDNYAEDISPPIEAVASEIIQNFKKKNESVNYLRNVSAVCRKCKRCQDTFLNETTSSASESFVLPALPPLPDLGLDRLRRLRKRPAIADVNFLWQRVSLNRTIINPHNISTDDSQIICDIDKREDEFSLTTQYIRKYEKDMLSFEMDLLGKHQNSAALEKLPFVLRLDALLSANSINWIFDFQMQCRGILRFTHKKMFTFSIVLAFDEIDSLGHEINLKSVKLEKGHVIEKNWKAIDHVLYFQLKLNLPFDIQSLCEDSDEAAIVKMLQIIDRVCLDTIKMGNHLQRISFANQSSIIRYGCRTYVRKIIRKIVNRTDSDFKYVEKTEVKVELLNLKKLSFKDITSPPLHHFREEIHLLPTGLQFLHEFLPNPFNYINHH